MQYQKEYHSPLGEMLLAADDEGLVGIWFQGAVHLGRGLEPGGREGEHPFLSEAERWLDCYFSGHEPEFQPPIHWSGTPFQQTCGGCCGRSHTGPPSPMENWPCVRRSSWAGLECRPRRWAGLWPAIRSPFWCPATGWWGRTAA